MTAKQKSGPTPSLTPGRGLGLLALALALCFVATAERLKTVPRQAVDLELQVALPLFVQVFMSAGDRYLAANLAAIRALVVTTDKMRPEDYRILGKIQEDASWLNPAHEDNYYIATAILPWNGELDAAQTILKRASQARQFDYQPAFYYAFHLLHFKGDAVGASAWLRAAAEKLPSDPWPWGPARETVHGVPLPGAPPAGLPAPANALRRHRPRCRGRDRCRSAPRSAGDPDAARRRPRWTPPSDAHAARSASRRRRHATRCRC